MTNAIVAVGVQSRMSGFERRCDARQSVRELAGAITPNCQSYAVATLRLEPSSDGLAVPRAVVSLALENFLCV